MKNQKKQNETPIKVKDICRAYRNNLKIDVSSAFPKGVTHLLYFLDPQTGIRHFKPNIFSDDLFYKKLSEFPWYYQNEKAEFQTAGMITKGRTVCEVGCGFGAFSHHAKASKFVGLELNSSAVNEARERGIEVYLESVDEHYAKLGSYRYDVVCAFQVLEHVADPDAFIGQLCQLLKPGGKLILSVPNDDSFIGFTPNNPLNLPPHHQTRWSIKALTKIEDRHPLRTIGVVSENLDPIHERTARLVTGSMIANVFSYDRNKSLLLSRLAYLVYKIKRRTISAMLGKSFSIFLRSAMRGHTITGIYEKENSPYE